MFVIWSISKKNPATACDPMMVCCYSAPRGKTKSHWETSEVYCKYDLIFAVPEGVCNLIQYIIKRGSRCKRDTPHAGPIPIIIPLKLFLEGINFLTDNVTSRVAWKLRGGGKVQKHVGISL